MHPTISSGGTPAMLGPLQTSLRRWKPVVLPLERSGYATRGVDARVRASSSVGTSGLVRNRYGGVRGLAGQRLRSGIGLQLRRRSFGRMTIWSGQRCCCIRDPLGNARDPQATTSSLDESNNYEGGATSDGTTIWFVNNATDIWRRRTTAATRARVTRLSIFRYQAAAFGQGATYVTAQRFGS